MNKTDTSAKPGLSDEEIGKILRDESSRAIGLAHGNNSDTLDAQREKALEYFKGEMKDLTVLPNRSSAVDTTVADTIETILPDLMGIFTEEDIVEFEPQGDDDVEAAKQETDFIRHVLFAQNKGWRHLYTAFKDALTVKLGIWHWWAEIKESKDENSVTVQDQVEGMAAIEFMEARGAEWTDMQEGDDGVITLTFISESKELKVCFKAVPPEDVWFSDDGDTLAECTYVAMRSRERVQTLIEDGYDEALVEKLSSYVPDDETRQARDTVDETDDGTDTAGTNGLRRVEVNAHFIRTDMDGEGIKTWRVVTGRDEGIVLDKQIVPSIPFAAITPFPNPHRLIGLSMVDKTMEVQRIKTSLLRMMLDSGYFALNQRNEVAETEATANTIPDLLNNTPGSPVRSKSGNAVRSIQTGGLDFDAAGALEYMATVNEMRSGVIRNNMGIGSDALHKTATGQQSQENMGQRRTRLIARIFAEMGFVDLCVGIHDLLRDTAFGPMRARINGDTVEVDPTNWGARKDMVIEIGSGGMDATRNALREVLQMLEQVVTLQGGLQGPVLDVSGIHRVLTKFIDTLPVKGLSGIFIDLERAEAITEQQEQAPDPQEQQAQAEMQAKQQDMQFKSQLESMKIEAKQQADIYRADKEQETSLKRAVIEAQTQTDLPALHPGGNVGR